MSGQEVHVARSEELKLYVFVIISLQIDLLVCRRQELSYASLFSHSLPFVDTCTLVAWM